MIPFDLCYSYGHSAPISKAEETELTGRLKYLSERFILRIEKFSSKFPKCCFL